jgi:Flp pilus assembly pilin Flp
MRSSSAISPAAHRARLSRRRGQTLVEYALVLAVLTVVMVACMKLLGTRIVVIFSDITAILDTAQSSH